MPHAQPPENDVSAHGRGLAAVGEPTATRAGVRECTHLIGPVVVIHTDGDVGARCRQCGVTLSQWLGEVRDGLYIELRGLVEDIKHHLHRVHRDTDDKSLASLHACAAHVPHRGSTLSRAQARHTRAASNV